MATLDASEIYLTPSDLAKSLQLHPAVPVRWMRRATVLSDGSRLCLLHLRVPGGFRTTRPWVDEFLQAIADDKAGAVNPAPKPPVKSARIRQLDADLQAAGFQARA
jgi:hypothetical protein